MVNILSIQEYSLVLHALSASLTCISCTFLFILITQSLTSPQHRLSIALCATLLLSASYHSFELLQSWKTAYQFQDGVYISSGIPFIEAHRHIDLMFTLPLLLSAFVCLFKETKQLSSLLARLIIATLFMTVLSYSTELCQNESHRCIYFLSANLFLFYILYVLWFELTPIIKRELHDVFPYMHLTRVLLIVSLPLYPVLYLMKTYHSIHHILIQPFYALSDIIVRVIPCLMCFLIAYAQTNKNNHETSPCQEIS